MKYRPPLGRNCASTIDLVNCKGQSFFLLPRSTARAVAPPALPLALIAGEARPRHWQGHHGGSLMRLSFWDITPVSLHAADSA